VDDGGVQCARCAALRILGLEPGATSDDVKRTYRVLVKVWHPDRFDGDSSMKEAAEAKLKDINSAYKLLCSTPAPEKRWHRSPRANPSASAQSQAPQAEPNATAYRAAAATAAASTGNASAWVFLTFKIGFRLFLLACAILLCRYLWIAFDVRDDSTAEAERAFGVGKDRLLQGLDAPKQRFLDAVEDDLRRFGFSKPAAPPADLPTTGDAAPANASPTKQVPHIKAPAAQLPRIQASPRKISSYITLGSTRSEVLDQQGTPTASTEGKLVYGRSELYFKGDAVVGWRIEPSSSIRVKLWPQTAVDPSLQAFSVGSSKDEVLAVQGTPTGFSEDRFEYGGSVVLFRNRRVVSWKSDPASIPLRAKLNY
jgi:hypothetical protein